MSLKALTAAWESKCGSPAEKLVLVALADYADYSFRCWPSVATLARRTELTERGVRQQIRKLEKAGQVVREASLGRRSNRYTLTLNAVQGKPGTVFPPTRNGVQGQPGTPRPSTLNTVHPIRKEPSLDPSGEPAPGGVNVGSGSGKATVTTADRISFENERERIADRFHQLDNEAPHTAWGPSYSPKQKQELKQLKDRDAELKKLLGCVV